jgi:hypothetical protein
VLGRSATAIYIYIYIYKVHVLHEKLRSGPDMDISFVTIHVREYGHEICNLICQLCL